MPFCLLSVFTPTCRQLVSRADSCLYVFLPALLTAFLSNCLHAQCPLPTCRLVSRTNCFLSFLLYSLSFLSDCWSACLLTCLLSCWLSTVHVLLLSVCLSTCLLSCWWLSTFLTAIYLSAFMLSAYICIQLSVRVGRFCPFFGISSKAKGWWLP